MIDLFMDELDKNDEKVFSHEDLELGFVSTAILFFFAGNNFKSISMYRVYTLHVCMLCC